MNRRPANYTPLLAAAAFAAAAILVIVLAFTTSSDPTRRSNNTDTSPASASPSASPADSSTSSALTPPAAPPAADGVVVTTDPAEVFRRAFWRHPSAEDRILDAERREWKADDTEGTVLRWQWFIALAPSDALLRTLRDEENPFSLAPTQAADVTAAESPPAWFPAASALARYEIHQSPSGGLTVLFSRDENRLFATDTGTGFAPPQTPVTTR